DSFGTQSVVYRDTPELRLRHLDVFGRVTRADWRQNARLRRQRRADCSSEWPEVTDGDGCHAAANCDRSIDRWILDHTKCDGAEVAFIPYPIRAAKAGLAVTECVVSKPDARRGCAPARLPEFFDWAIRYRKN